MTHIIREGDKSRARSKTYQQEICESVTVVETPPLVAVGIVGYIKSPRGLRSLNTIFAKHLSEESRRRFYKNWYASTKRKAFTRYANKYSVDKKFLETELEEMKRHCCVVRVLCHTQVQKVSGLKDKKSQIMELQVFGGSISDKIIFSLNFLEKKILVDAIFKINELVDIIAISKGKGTIGVISRWGVTRLPRKTHRGLRKVACIGSWHPSAVSWTVGRTGQKGYHHRVERNKNIYRIGKLGQNSFTGSTEYDLTDKSITPMGGFTRYGIIKNDYIILKGSVPGPSRRMVTLRCSLFSQASHESREKTILKFIDTSSKFGHGHFQTSLEKSNMFTIIKA
jgi:large subunit ribosomal protein L3e